MPDNDRGVVEKSRMNPVGWIRFDGNDNEVTESLAVMYRAAG
jgi:hypothetical protein